MAGEERWRLFVGAYPPEIAVRNIDSAITRWKVELGDPAIKWVPRDKLHLTLCFLGNVEASAVPALTQTLRQSTSTFQNFPLRISGLGVFPKLQRPRVFWAGIDGDVDKLFSLQRDVAEACRAYVQEPDEKKFSAHLTLARLKNADPSIASCLQKVIGRDSKIAFGEWRFEELRLIRSELSGKGSTYTTLATYPLAKSP